MAQLQEAMPVSRMPGESQQAYMTRMRAYQRGLNAAPAPAAQAFAPPIQMPQMPQISNPFAGVDWSTAFGAGPGTLWSSPQLQGLSPFDKMAIAGEQDLSKIWSNPDYSWFGKMGRSILPGAAAGIGGAIAGAGNMLATPFTSGRDMQAYEDKRGAAKSAFSGAPSAGTAAPEAPLPAPSDPFAAFMGGGGAAQPVRTVSQTSGSPEALAAARQGMALAMQGAQDRKREFNVQGAPVPEAPKFQKTDYSGMDAAIAMLKPEEFAEDVERKKLALPYLMSGIAQGGFSASEDAGIGTILFKMGMGALNSKALVDDEITRRREKYEGNLKEYARALANGEQEKARVSAEEANRDILSAYEREVGLANFQQPKVGADGSLVQQQIDPKTGAIKVTTFTPGDAVRAASQVAQFASVISSSTPRTNVTTQTGGSASKMPDFVMDEMTRRMRISTGEPPSRIIASDVVKYNLYAQLGLNEDDMTAVDEEATRIANSQVGMNATPASMTAAYQNARLNVLASLIDSNNGQKVIGAMRAQGLNPGASFVKVD